MGRSVSTPPNAVAVAYTLLEDHDGAYEDRLEDLQECAPTLWPSLRPCDTWLGRENHAILENDHAYVGLSEYRGLVAIWIVPKTENYSGYSDPHKTLCEAWCRQVAPKFVKTWATLERLGTMSNGESVYKCITPGVY